VAPDFVLPDVALVDFAFFGIEASNFEADFACNDVEAPCFAAKLLDFVNFMPKNAGRSLSGFDLALVVFKDIVAFWNQACTAFLKPELLLKPNFWYIYGGF
jgi:hypothetical protein